MIRSVTIVIVAWLLLMLVPAFAAGEPVSCWQIQQLVRLHGEDAVRQQARARGYTESQISDAKRLCLTRRERTLTQSR